ncbi:hypothetical protein [Sphingomonas jeddahensis]|uniref:Uncharacterized protein n=1 Tax=Sphingomonas jeddahensis TaxID=1915074 RepID=A0A1V2ESS1_9SPHN|nr:hypothetical protein [Sphingomonas jeddahensis]ONF95722.1 hypothetical protein SPHI_21600 [Sphingomonas jeddahensis]
MRYGAPLLGLALLATPAAAQVSDSRTRIDDFAVPAPADAALPVEQVAARSTSLDTPQQAPDRMVSTQQRADQRGVRAEQLSSTGASGAPAQLSADADSTAAIPGAGSTAADSRPRGVVRIAGSDRCDPQLAAQERAQCLRILELRAQEFNAPAPPRLSAEESLLAAQRSEVDRRAAPSPETRLRLASVPEPDADLGSNQEVAAIYLRRSEPIAEPTPQELSADAATLAEILTSVTEGTPRSSP